VREVLLALADGDIEAEIPNSYTPQGEELVTKAAQIHAKFGLWA